jgi:hypothetical protein
VILSICAITVAFISIVTIRARAAAFALESARAFWLAEAGIQRVAGKLKSDASYRDNPTNIPTTSLGGGTYSVTIIKQPSEPEKTDYIVDSTGQSGSTSRKINQTVTVLKKWGEAFTKYGLFGGDGGALSNINMQHTSRIEGGAYTSGSVVCNSTITELTYAGNGVTGNGTYSAAPAMPNPLPATPTLVTTTYDDEIDKKAALEVAGNMTVENLNLSGGTRYINGTVTIKGNITGPGSIVGTGDIALSKDAVVGQNITLISGRWIDFGQSSRVQPGGVLYARQGVSMKQFGAVVDKCTIITPGNMDLWQSVTVNGAILCGGNLDMKQAAAIRGGSVINGSITMTQSSSLVLDILKLPPQTPEGVVSEISVVLSKWQETTI